MAFFKDKVLKQVSGYLERIGVTPCGDTTITYVLVLSGNMHHCNIHLEDKERFIFAVTKAKDSVSFECEEEGSIVKETFLNHEI